MFVTLMPCLYVLLCGPKIRNKDSCILYLVRSTVAISNPTRVCGGRLRTSVMASVISLKYELSLKSCQMSSSTEI